MFTFFLMVVINPVCVPQLDLKSVQVQMGPGLVGVGFDENELGPGNHDMMLIKSYTEP